VQPAYIIFLVLFILLLTRRRQEKAWLKHHIQSKKRKDREPMIELAKRFIGKECIVYTFNSQVTGTVKEVSDSAILLENGSNPEAVNLDFIVRIREYPRKKNGKKKSVILD